MSLRIWLPLTKDLRNQGLDEVTPIATGAVTIDNNGKLGKCYKFGTATGRITLPASTMTSFTECSFALWININSWQTGWDTVFQAGLGNSPWNNYIFGILRNQGNKLIFCISNNSNSTQGAYGTPDLTLGTWYHLVFTYKTGHCCIYVNGVLHQDYSASIVPKFSAITYISIGQLGNATSYQCDCKMNDVRIYDHCLSPMEVKELSQGLVLHYPLNNNGFGNENLVLNSNTFATGSGASGITPSTTSDGLHQVIATSGNSNWHASWATSTATSLLENAFAEGDPFTISFTIKSENANKTNPPDIYVKSGMGYYSMQGSVTSNWSTIYYSGTWKDANSISFHLGFSGRVGTYLFKNWKVEKGSKVTPWCPNSSDDLATTMGMNDGIEYDTSGFCNNGTRTGTFSWTSDTPRYMTSTVFSSGTDIESTNPLTTCSQFTVAGWINLSTGYVANNGFHLIGFDGTYCRICISKDGVAVRILLTDGTTNYAGGSAMRASALIAEEWNHYAITFDEGNINIYVNGVLDTTTTATITSVSFPTSIIRIGRHGTEQPNGKASDLRFYATALSADDILSLYNLGGSLDSNGTFHTYEYVEV